MSVQYTTSKDAAASAETKLSSSDDEIHVPEWAEDMEHTLKRLNEKKQAKRDKQPGLYL